MAGLRKILFVGHDNLLEHEEGLSVDFLGGLGRSMGQTKREFRKDNLATIFRVLCRTVLRQYDQVILPAALLVRTIEGEGPSFKRMLATIIFCLSDSRFVTACSKKIIGFLTRKKPVAFIGRYSQMTVHRQIFQFFPDSILFKTIAHRSYDGFPNVEVRPLNYYINVECYPELPLKDDEARSIGVFYVGAMKFRQRQLAPEIESLAFRSGVDFRWERGRLEFDEYINKLADSRVAWSPEGSNWQCWRHYESLYYGAVPLINRPDPRIYHTFRDGETAIFYDDPADAVLKMKAILDGELRLSLSPSERRRFVIENHSEYALGSILRRSLGF